MAIIRIKRTTSSTLPTGLTFGELAFVGASGGATANRLYIAGPEGTCLWIGAQILNQPTYWSGVTAETTVPTVNAVRDFVNGFVGATVFSSNVTVNLSGSKTFGKYENGQQILSAGKTPIQVILDAVIESVPPTVTLTRSTTTADGLAYTANIPFGATAISNTLSWSYIINTPGSTATSGRIQGNTNGTWVDLTTTAYDTSSAFHTQNQTNTPFTGTYTHTYERTVADAFGASPSGIQYRYILGDDVGQSVTSSPTVSISGTAYISPSVITNNSSLISGQEASGETFTDREKGKTGSVISLTLRNSNFVSGKAGNQYVRWLGWKVEYSKDNNNWFTTLSNGTNGSATSLNTSFNSISTGQNNQDFTFTQTIHPLGVSEPINTIYYRVKVAQTINTTNNDTSGGNQATWSTANTVNLKRRLFWGATASVPTTAAQIRTLPQTELGPNAGVNFGGWVDKSLTVPGGGQSQSNRHLIIAIPKNAGLTGDPDLGSISVDVAGVIDGSERLYGNVNTAQNSYVKNDNGPLEAALDYGGNSVEYNIYVYSQSVAPNDQKFHTFKVGGTVSST